MPERSDEMPDRFREFAVRARLGAGGMGTVYRVADPGSGRDVALKALHDRGPEAIYQIKREFRAVCDVVHPNLVELYDLVVEPDHAFFTMELVEGVDLVTWVRGPGAPEGLLSVEGCDRLRAALPQVIEGLAHLHHAGWLHRDVKPQNVLVTAGGRVVLLDFGLAHTTVALAPPEESAGLVGTLAYMAPEQGLGRAVAASDLYAVGVALFEALCGRIPFDPRARLSDLILGRRMHAPVEADFPRGTPDDLRALAIDLMHPEADARPSPPEVLTRLGVSRGIEARASAIPFVGRDEERARLGAALRRRPTRPTVVHVWGASGIGKTALVRRALDEVHATTPLVLLAGRCNVQEAVAFKALDNVIDVLCALPAIGEVCEAALAHDYEAYTVAEVFPAFRRVREVGDRWRAMGEERPSRVDPGELRRSAFASVECVLRELTRRERIVVWIDDAQWCDADSLPLLQRLALHGDAPPLCLVLSYRAEDRAAASPLRDLDPSRAAEGVEVVTLDVAALPSDAVRAIVEHAVGASVRSDVASVSALVDESVGVPFLARELSLFCASRGAYERGLRADDVVRLRVDALHEEARRLLDMVAVADGPLALDTALRAAGPHAVNRLTVGSLRTSGLVRHVETRSGPAVDAYHDRIRERVREALPADERADRHRALALALEASPDADPARVHRHWLGAGDRPRARRYAITAAEAAAQAFAFEHASRLYATALELLDDADVATRVRLLAGRGAACAAYGRAAEGARCYLEAASLVEGAAPSSPDLLLYTRLAAELLLQSGNPREGERVLRRVLDAVGVSLPTSPAAALAAVLWQRARLNLRGLQPKPRPAVRATHYHRLDALWAGSTGLVWVDPIRSGVMHAQHVREALDSGEPMRVLRAYAGEAVVLGAMGGDGNRARAELVLTYAERVAAELNTPAAEGLAGLARAIVHYFSGRFREAVEASYGVDRVLRERCTGVAFEVTNLQMFTGWARQFSGDLAGLAATTPTALSEALARDDLLAYVGIATSMPSALRWFAADAPRAARDEVEAAMARWPGDGMQSPHLQAHCVRVYADLYEGDARGAWVRMADTWPSFERTLHLQFQSIRSITEQLRASCAASAAASMGPGETLRARGRTWTRDALLVFALRLARRLAKDGGPWAGGWARALTASVTSLRGDRHGARAHLVDAERGFDQRAMGLMANITNHRLAALSDGDERRAREDRASQWFAAQGVASPERFARMFLPAMAG